MGGGGFLPVCVGKGMLAYVYVGESVLWEDNVVVFL